MHEKIIVYHGTSFQFQQIDLNKSKDNRDFGKGFYTTTIQSQAESWAKNIALRNNSEHALYMCMSLPFLKNFILSFLMERY